MAGRFPAQFAWRAFLVGIAASCAFVVGCGGEPTGQITGVVTYQGRPAEGAELRLVPDANQDELYSGISGKQGRYQVTYRGQDGLPVGGYKITITVYMIPGGVPFPPGERADTLKADGKLIETSFVFEEEIKAGPNTIDFELTKGQKVVPAQ
jgi:hypothetical protein